MSRSASLFTKPRAGKLSPNRTGLSARKAPSLHTGATRDVIDAADAFLRRRERAEPVRHQIRRGA